MVFCSGLALPLEIQWTNIGEKYTHDGSSSKLSIDHVRRESHSA